jgi:hypothetical protein
MSATGCCFLLRSVHLTSDGMPKSAPLTSATMKEKLLPLGSWSSAARVTTYGNGSSEHFRTRKRQRLSLDPLVTRKLQAWMAIRGREPGPLLVQVRLGKVAVCLLADASPGDSVHRLLQTMGAKLGGVIRAPACGSRRYWMRPTAMSGCAGRLRARLGRGADEARQSQGCWR